MISSSWISVPYNRNLVNPTGLSLDRPSALRQIVSAFNELFREKKLSQFLCQFSVRCLRKSAFSQTLLTVLSRLINKRLASASCVFGSLTSCVFGSLTSCVFGSLVNLTDQLPPQ